MLTKTEIKELAFKLDFSDVGFTTAAPFTEQKEILLARREMYAWVEKQGLDLLAGTDPAKIMPEAKSIIVLLDNYCRTSFPSSLTGKFGRCYLDDDRITRDGLSRRIKTFIAQLQTHGVRAKASFNLPHRLAAARAGVGNFGKNCLLYANRTARGSSWVIPVAIITDKEFEPDQPTLEIGCPSWCRNACMVACPTGALTAPRTIDPRRCISYLTYLGEDLPPPALRETMGIWVYGCDRCQEVCPRNRAWLSQELPVNEKVSTRAENFALERLLLEDDEYYRTFIWPHMFYIPLAEKWRWQINAARAMGNSLDPAYIPYLATALEKNPDERVKIMAAWALGRIGGQAAMAVLTANLRTGTGIVREEIEQALAKVNKSFLGAT